MADSLGTTIEDERSEAIRLLLGTPLLDIEAEPAGARLVFRHGDWLVEWFEDTLGFRLVVDGSAGFARLFKRSDDPDTTRPLRRSRGSKAPFDRRRYQLLCLTCASLVRQSVTTIGLLADSLRADAQLDTTLRRERAAIVDVLRMLVQWGIVRFRGGDIDAYVDSEEMNAILTADSHRLHHLLASVTAPAKLDPHDDLAAAIEALLAEPRYGAGAEASTEAQRLRWTRHHVARAVFDNPVVHFEQIHPAVAEYLRHPSGRKWIRERAHHAGFELEERLEGVMAIDTSAVATDVVFPSPLGTAGQMALLFIDELVRESGGDRSLGSLNADDVRRFTRRQLKAHPNWARSHRDGDGPERLATEAIQLLAMFGLVQVDEHGGVVACPALGRYRVASPTTAADHHGDDHDGDEPLPPPPVDEQMLLL